MKTRHGFVSNSSSSSFCIIGVVDSVAELLLDREFPGESKQEKQDKFSYASFMGNVLSYYGYVDCLYAGIEADDLLEKMTIPEAKKFFLDICKKSLGVDIDINLVSFIYGEVSSE